MPTFILYSRIGCHLCDEMQQQLQTLQQQQPFSFTVVDVDDDLLLQQRYGEQVPVLSAGEQALFYYPFNPDVFLQYLKNPV